MDAERSLAASAGSGQAPVSTGLKGTGLAPLEESMWRRATATEVLPTPVSVPRMKIPGQGRAGEGDGVSGREVAEVDFGGGAAVPWRGWVVGGIDAIASAKSAICCGV